ncbi:MAG: GNAT family N-acetyltransferase [Segetibacter sp.]
MEERFEQPKRFIIEKAALEDVDPIGEAQLQSWRETYPNEELGITKEWIEEQVGFLTEKAGNDFRRKTIVEAMQPTSPTLYLVVKDKNGSVYGFLHVTRKEVDACFDAIYLTKDVQGTGIAQELMQKALDFIGDLPIELEVASYNKRAIAFYESYDFKIIERKKEFHKGKIPLVAMMRELKNEI